MADEGIASSGLDASDVRASSPELRLMPGERALHHREGGTVLARAGMEAMARAAAGLSASLISPERVVSLETSGLGVRLVTAERRIDAGVAVVATGPWANELLTPLGLGLPLAPAVAQVTYFDIPSLRDTARACGMVSRRRRPRCVRTPGAGRGVQVCIRRGRQ